MNLEKEICEKIKDILNSYMSCDFEKIIFNIFLTDNFNKNNVRVTLKCISQFREISGLIFLKISNLFRELRKIMQSKGQDWSQCYFYVTKDNKYYANFVLNPYIAKDYKKSNKPSMIESFVNNFK